MGEKHGEKTVVVGHEHVAGWMWLWLVVQGLCQLLINITLPSDHQHYAKAKLQFLSLISYSVVFLFGILRDHPWNLPSQVDCVYHIKVMAQQFCINTFLSLQSKDNMIHTVFSVQACGKLHQPSTLDIWTLRPFSKQVDIPNWCKWMHVPMDV